MEKITNVKALAYVLENCELPTEVSEKLTKMMEQNIKHNASKSTKPTKKQDENTALKKQIVSEMEVDKPYTVGELVKSLPCCNGLSSQKVSAMVNQLVDDVFFIKQTEKRTSYFIRKA